MGSIPPGARYAVAAFFAGIEFEAWRGGWWVAAVGLGVLGLTAGVYILDLRGRGLRQHRILPILRVAAVAVLLLIYLRPVRYWSATPPEKPTVAILVDASASMMLEEKEDGGGTRTRLARALNLLESGFVRELERRFRVRAFRFDRSTSEAAEDLRDLSADTKEPASGTNLGQAMLDANERLAAESLAAEIVLTDGAWNEGPEPVRVAGELGARAVAVFPVIIGSGEDHIDIAVESVLADDSVLPGDKIRVETVIRGRGLAGRKLDVRVLNGDAHVIGASPTVGPDGFARESLVFAPPEDTPADQPAQFTLAVPPQKGELSPENNRMDFRVRLVDRPIKVLLLEELPRWEFRYLRNALMRDPGIEVECLLLNHRGFPVRGDRYREWYPDRAEALAEFDVIVFGDVPPGRFTPMQLEATRGFVDAEAGALVFQAGTRATPRALLNTPLEDLLPVSPGTGPGGRASHPAFGFELSPEGNRHPAFAILDEPGSALPRWEELPGFRWFFPVASAKPAATVLATHPSLQARIGKIPIVAAMRYGHGRVLYLGVDETWRWRFVIGDEVHYRFWGRMVRWLAENRFQGGSPLVRLTLDRRRCRSGETVRIHARVLDRDRYPLENGDVLVEYETAEGEGGVIPLAEKSERRGEYAGQFTPRRAGEYVLHPRIPSLAGEELGTELALTVEDGNRELENPGPDRDTLARVATASGGSLHTPETADEIARRIRPRRPAAATRRKTDLWDSPPVIALVTVLLGSEWWLRRRRGLP